MPTHLTIYNLILAHFRCQGESVSDIIIPIKYTWEKYKATRGQVTNQHSCVLAHKWLTVDYNIHSLSISQSLSLYYPLQPLTAGDFVNATSTPQLSQRPPPTLHMSALRRFVRHLVQLVATYQPISRLCRYKPGTARSAARYYQQTILQIAGESHSERASERVSVLRSLEVLN